VISPALQCAHQFLGAEASAYRLLIDRADADNVERYLNTCWQLRCDMPPFARLRPWFREYKREVEHGQIAVRSLLDVAAAVRDRLGHTEATILRELADEIGEVVDEGCAAWPP
jgi:hypothetical protein